MVSRIARVGQCACLLSFVFSCTSPLILVVKSTLPVKTVPDLVAYAKEHPGKLSYGSAGVGTGQHIVGEWVKK
jgi:tripartite-type tricarboxylate transporter receptor subunit TctC